MKEDNLKMFIWHGFRIGEARFKIDNGNVYEPKGMAVAIAETKDEANAILGKETHGFMWSYKHLEVLEISKCARHTERS